MTGIPLIAFVFALVWLPALGQDLVAVPPLSARVTDLTGTLSRSQLAQLESKLADFEARKRSQIAVLIVPTTRPEAIEQYSIRVAEQRKLGRKGVDDGVLFLIAKNDREVRIEVGYGLEGALPDVIAKRIVEDMIVPQFRAGNFHSGIDAGVDAMVKVIDGEQLPLRQDWLPADRGGSLAWLFIIGTLLAVVASVILYAMMGPLPAAAVVAGAAGVITWLVMSSLIATALAGFIVFLFTLFVTMLLAIVGAILRALMGRLPAAAIVGGAAGVIAALALDSLVNAAGAGLVAFLLALSGPTPRIGRLRTDDWPGGGFRGGDSSRDDFGGGSSGGGGGFSGGGGSFGGGGASGRW